MKMKKIWIALLLVVAILTALPVSAAERQLTLDRAVQINDTQIVLEFSEPIAINLEQLNRGPYAVIRLVSNGDSVRITDMSSKYYGLYLEWQGNLEFVDRRHDRLIWTLDSNEFGVKTIHDIRNYAGDLADYSKYKVAMTLEEVPYDTQSKYTDDAICNITTLDGKVHLTPTHPHLKETCNLAIEEDYTYWINRNAVESTKDVIGYSSDLVVRGDEVEIEEPVIETETKEVVIENVWTLKNDPYVIAVILSAPVLVGLIWIIVALIVRKKKAVKK